MSATASRPKVRPLDPLDLDGLLSDEDRLIAETVRRFATDRVLPHVEEWYEEGTLPTRDLAPAIGELGLLGMHLSGYGCAGASATNYGVACRELEAADSGLRSFVSVQGSLAMFPIWKFGSDEQKERWLPGMAAGELIGCFGLTEPDSGSDPSSMKTNAKRDGSDWVLNGAKMWITNGGVSDVAVVWAKTDDGIRGFVVPRDTQGLHDPGHPPQALAARVDHLRARLRRRPPARGRGPARRHRDARPAVVPERGALRDPLGRRRRRAHVPRDRARLREEPAAVRPPDRRRSSSRSRSS